MGWMLNFENELANAPTASKVKLMALAGVALAVPAFAFYPKSLTPFHWSASGLVEEIQADPFGSALGWVAMYMAGFAFASSYLGAMRRSVRAHKAARGTANV